jgi:hypothetical protein
LSETAKQSQKQQSVVGNDKASSETTRQLFVLSSLKSKNLENVIASRGGILMPATLKPIENICIHATTN